ncbi:hypothetical protein [Alkalihalobacillus sp. AL-G]|uniref:hypothetical protein n=1 Tax=Alkalihalobacillus sp. AL-G TaxID=2926399 RepID=UPI00272A34D5|nr:hypothetical protein [Alkalihalobacillus sp. AL-G]WLD94674.1 hypothetical protein MOJ78_07265 [Alkalihalobacillus sp. AL-G]
MRIVGYEIRKLLNWKVLGLVLLISLLFFEMFLRFNFEVFPNGRPTLDHFNVSKQMIDKYGNEMDETEFKNFKVTYEEEVQKASGYLQSRDDFAAVDVTTYEQFREMDLSKEKLKKLHGDVIFHEEVDVFWELQARDSIIEHYEKRKESFLRNTSEIDKPAWKENVVEGSSINAILPSFVHENYLNLITMLVILILLSVMIVVGRIHITDQKNNAILLQYTTHSGRNLFKKKIVASIVTALLITTVYLVVFFILYSQNETGAFFDSSVHSFDGWFTFWVDITFFQYIVLTVLGVYVLAIITAAISTFLSRLVGSYISLIGVHVPAAVILILLIREFLIRNLMSIQYPMYLTVCTYTGLLILGSALLILRWIKERRIDIV